MADFAMTDYVRELNLAGVALARRAVDEMNLETPDRRRFVAGSIGPTSKQLSVSGSVSDPAYRAVTFDQMVDNYYEQIDALVEAALQMEGPRRHDFLQRAHRPKFFDERGIAWSPDGEAIACFAGDLSSEEQGVVYATHFAPALDLFTQKHDGVAWRSKPSWSIVATEDRTVHPDLERFAAKRMGATTVELKSSHVPMLSHPKHVLDVIRSAAAAVQKSAAMHAV